MKFPLSLCFSLAILAMSAPAQACQLVCLFVPYVPAAGMAPANNTDAGCSAAQPGFKIAKNHSMVYNMPNLPISESFFSADGSWQIAFTPTSPGGAGPGFGYGPSGFTYAVTAIGAIPSTVLCCNM